MRVVNVQPTVMHLAAAATALIRIQNLPIFHLVCKEVAEAIAIAERGEYAEPNRRDTKQQVKPSKTEAPCQTTPG
jgi:hypothetical protein